MENISSTLPETGFRVWQYFIWGRWYEAELDSRQIRC